MPHLVYFVVSENTQVAECQRAIQHFRSCLTRADIDILVIQEPNCPFEFADVKTLNVTPCTPKDGYKYEIHNYPQIHMYDKILYLRFDCVFSLRNVDRLFDENIEINKMYVSGKGMGFLVRYTKDMILNFIRAKALVTCNVFDTHTNATANPIDKYTLNDLSNAVDAILYINLKHREDRNHHILTQLTKVCKDATKIHRIDAIKASPGSLGCGLSHIKALEYALSHQHWKRVWIVEDDFTFKSACTDEISGQLHRFLCSAKDFDVGLMAYNHRHVVHKNTEYSFKKRAFLSVTTSSYIICRHYIPTLIRNFTESTDRIKSEGEKLENCIDIHWSKLMQSDKWYAISPALGYQCDGYSDIANKHVEYGC